MQTTKVTHGVKISVSTAYQAEYSDPRMGHYVHTYKIKIENNTGDTIQLLNRHWFIFDSNASLKEVEGKGVIGIQPIIEPGAFHEYISGCDLKTEIGKMHGSYTMIRLNDDYMFEVNIPEFQLIAPFKLN